MILIVLAHVKLGLVSVAKSLGVILLKRKYGVVFLMLFLVSLAALTWYDATNFVIAQYLEDVFTGSRVPLSTRMSMWEQKLEHLEKTRPEDNFSAILYQLGNSYEGGALHR